MNKSGDCTESLNELEAHVIISNNYLKSKSKSRLTKILEKFESNKAINCWVLQANNVKQLKKLKQEDVFKEIKVIVLEDSKDFDKFLKTFSNQKTIFELNHGESLSFRVKNCRLSMQKFLGILQLYKISFLSGEITRPADKLIYEILTETLSATDKTNEKELEHMLELTQYFNLNYSSNEVFKLLAIAFSRKLKAYCVYIVNLFNPKVLPELPSKPSYLEAVFRSLKLKFFYENLRKSIQLATECNRIELLRFLTAENHHKFLEIFVALYFNIPFDEWKKEIEFAIKKEFFDIVKVLLNVKTDLNYEVSEYAMVLSDVEDFFESIGNKNEGGLKKFMKIHPEIKVCRYSSTTALDYALDVAIKCKSGDSSQFHAYSLLRANSFEPIDKTVINAKIEKLSSEKKKFLRDSNVKFAKLVCKKSHISIVHSKFKHISAKDKEVLSENTLSDWINDEMMSMLNELSNEEAIDLMLRIISMEPKLEVVVDPENLNVYKIDPTQGEKI